MIFQGPDYPDLEDFRGIFVLIVHYRWVVFSHQSYIFAE